MNAILKRKQALDNCLAGIDTDKTESAKRAPEIRRKAQVAFDKKADQDKARLVQFGVRQTETERGFNKFQEDMARVNTAKDAVIAAVGALISDPDAETMMGLRDAKTALDEAWVIAR